MAGRPKVDHKLVLDEITVTYKDGSTSTARMEGNNAAWICKCGSDLPLLGRCYFQFGDTCFTVCEDCKRRFRVAGDDKKRAVAVNEE